MNPRKAWLLWSLETWREVILEIQKSEVTILLADQNIKFCRKVAGRGYIIEKGLIQYQGEMNDIWQNEEMVRKYLAV